MPDGFSFEKVVLDLEKVLLDGVKSAEPPTNSGSSLTKKSKETCEDFLVAIEESLLLHSFKNSLYFSSKSPGMSDAILLLSSLYSCGYFSL